MTFLLSLRMPGKRSWIALLRSMPLLTAFSRFVAMKSSDSATMVLSTVLGPEIDCEPPTARNSNLLPVKANGLVRLRSPACRGSLGKTDTPTSMKPPCLVLLAWPFSSWSITSWSWSPRNTDRMAGGAMEDLHGQHLVVGGQVGVLEERRDLVLAGGDLVVPGLDRHAQLEQLGLAVGHAGQHALVDGAEVLVLQFLALGRRGAEE